MSKTTQNSTTKTTTTKAKVLTFALDPKATPEVLKTMRVGSVRHALLTSLLASGVYKYTMDELRECGVIGAVRYLIVRGYLSKV